MCALGISAGMRLEPFGTQQGVGQVKQQAQRDEAGERIIEYHGRAPPERLRAKRTAVRANETRQKLKSFTGVGVTHGRNEEAEAEGQHENVQHEMLLCGMACGAIRIAFSPRLDREVPFGA
jgi:hypothetical protein